MVLLAGAAAAESDSGPAPEPLRTIRVAAIQFHVVPGSVADNLAKAERLIREAARRGAGYALLPELYAMFPAARERRPVEEVRAEAQPITGELTTRMLALAAELELNIAYGMSESRGDEIYNSTVLLGPGGVAGVYSKRFLVGLGAEGRTEESYFSGGKGPTVARWGGVATGVLICADGGFDALWSATRNAGSQLILWPSSGLGWNLTGAARRPPDWAREYAVPVVTVSPTREVPLIGGVATVGGSSEIIDATGKVLASAGLARDEVLVADVPIGPIAAVD